MRDGATTTLLTCKSERNNFAVSSGHRPRPLQVDHVHARSVLHGCFFLMSQTLYQDFAEPEVHSLCPVIVLTPHKH
jgi:hypothetical protein